MKGKKGAHSSSTGTPDGADGSLDASTGTSTRPDELDPTVRDAPEETNQAVDEEEVKDEATGIMEFLADQASLATAQMLNEDEDIKQEHKNTGMEAQLSNTPQRHHLSFFPKGQTPSVGTPLKGLATRQTLKEDEDAKQGEHSDANMAREINKNAKVEEDDTAANSRNAATSIEQGVGLNRQSAELAAVLPAALPEPIPLQRQQQPPSRPGAYMNLPGGALQRATTLQYSLVGAASQDALIGQMGDTDHHDSTTAVEPALNPVLDPTLFPNQARQSGATTDHLAVANRVTNDPEDLMHANPVDLEEQEKRKQEKKKFRQTLLFIVFLVVSAVAAVIGTVTGTAGKNNAAVVYQTPSPTVYGTMTPSDVPSTSPTGALNFLLDTLPDSTVARINNGSDKPQWKAWQWLAEHQNITFLPEWRKEQLFALATFFYAFEGDNWNPLVKGHGWMDDTKEECEWFSSAFGVFGADGRFLRFEDLGLPAGSSCDGHGQFTSLWLNGLQLSGLQPSVPPEISLLTSLSFFGLHVNDIAAPISTLLPSEFYELTGLSYLGLNANVLSGDIPSELGQLTLLTSLELNANQLSGQIPSEFALLTSILWLQLNDNQFTGPVPAELGLLTSFYTLRLAGNQLSGQIPSEFALLTSILWLELNDNQFTGPVPSELGLLTSLTKLLLALNQFSGPLPSEIGFLTSLAFINLHYNQLTGPLPSELGFLNSLEELALDENQFSGTLPSELGLLALLEEVVLSGNQFTGTIPTEIGMMTSLTSMDLHNNGLMGTLPMQLNVSMGLRLYGNTFSGTVPDHLCSFLNCDCSLNETPPVSTCAGLAGGLRDWPGWFPTTVADVMLNIQTDRDPLETSWVWQQETNVTGIWDTLESGGPLALRSYLYSSLLPISADTAYRLIVYDSFGDGLYVPGWVTLTAENKTVLYSYVSTTDDFASPSDSDFSEVTIGITVRADGSLDITNSTS
ncbi:expressed unknown protein [Seminavis robusta]|uniref:Uncharacterized protein n=1 Tax=Seminavis robusta TaxID=568900 RepID=A0A9N8HCL2_9STRA|nr:expressed unknown protein [Seminavis robusta]|eukprot:Sro307_g113161.1  (965) ;mRNA; f:9175-12069